MVMKLEAETRACLVKIETGSVPRHVVEIANAGSGLVFWRGKNVLDGVAV